MLKFCFAKTNKKKYGERHHIRFIKNTYILEAFSLLYVVFPQNPEFLKISNKRDLISINNPRTF